MISVLGVSAIELIKYFDLTLKQDSKFIGSNLI